MQRVLRVVALQPHDDKNGTVATILKGALGVAVARARELGLDLNCSTVDLADWLSREEPHNNSIPDSLKPIANIITGADVVVVGMGVQWGVPYRLKQLFGCLTALESGKRARLTGKVAFCFAHFHEDGAQAALNEMYGILGHFGCATAPNSQAFRQKGFADSENGWQEEVVRIGIINAITMAALFRGFLPAGQVFWLPHEE